MSFKWDPVVYILQYSINKLNAQTPEWVVFGVYFLGQVGISVSVCIICN